MAEGDIVPFWPDPSWTDTHSEAYRERERRREQAEQRANALLAQYATLNEHGYYAVKGSRGGTWLIGPHYGAAYVGSPWGDGAFLPMCVVALDQTAPMADKILMKILALKADEGRFLTVANSVGTY